MFNVGPFELIVLAVVGLVVLGPDRLPGLARDAARMIKTLRELSTGARQQLRDELGPEFADVDLRNLNPRTAIQRAVFGDEDVDLSKYDPRRFDARSAARNLIDGSPASDDANGAGGADGAGGAVKPVSFDKRGETGARANGASPNGTFSNGASAAAPATGTPATGTPATGTPAARPRPRPRPGPARSAPPPPSTGYDDVT